jgi:hypothetical protein
VAAAAATPLPIGRRVSGVEVDRERITGRCIPKGIGDGATSPSVWLLLLLLLLSLLDDRPEPPDIEFRNSLFMFYLAGLDLFFQDAFNNGQSKIVGTITLGDRGVYSLFYNKRVVRFSAKKTA